LRTPKIPRNISGYGLHYLLPEEGFNLAAALVGSECSLVMILEATTKLVYSYPARSLVVLGYPDVYAAGDHVKDIVEFGPIALEGMDDLLISFMQKKNEYPKATQLLPKGNGWLMVEFGGATKEESDALARKMMEAVAKKPDAPTMKLFDDKKEEDLVWKAREGGLGATAFVPGMPDTWEGWEDSACPPEHLGDYLRDLRALFAKYDYHPALYGHFGQGCIHCRVAFDLFTEEGIKHWRAFLTEGAQLVASYGGSLSGEHGDGQSRAELLPIMFGETMCQAFREFKNIWDPAWKMNPGKKINPYPITSNLRYGTDYDPPVLDTHFKFPDDNGSFAHAAMRCVGVGECRRLEGKGSMCPSFMVTREERDSTRGRARSIFEMLNGQVLKDGWKNEEVKEALDLCFACKGCKGDCPVNVDMATYKAEFLSHYYEGKPRPRPAYAMGLIYWWARLAEHMPELVNSLAHAPGLAALGKKAAGIALEREIPPFAPQTFKAWWRARAPRNVGKSPVLLWPDTFNNHFRPDIAIAAVEVLEASGYQVIVPDASLCCGRPLYDYGFLDKAEALLKRILSALKPYIEAGIPMVGLEPSCVAVFRDELCNLYPTDEDAKRLKQQTFMLSEFIEKEQIELPQLKKKALVHGHCHHKAIMKMDAEEKVLSRLGLDFEVLDSGCCGMAGSFGFEAEHYDISIEAGERVLLPAVRKADPNTLIITNGFSCREQIEQTTNREPLHLAQVLHQAFKESGRLLGDSDVVAPSAPGAIAKAPQPPKVGTAVIVAGAALLGTVLWRLVSRKKR
jgi:Fe-S oxidoreductase